MKANKIQSCPQTLAIAPMMDWTDRHYRYLMRLMSEKTVLYTEMFHANTLLYQEIPDLIFKEKGPCIFQLGGNSPDTLAKAAQLVEKAGYDGVNLNVGCPSPRVQSGAFGACLMKDPSLVADCYQAMQEAVNIDVSIKSRIGVDDCQPFPFLSHFIETLSLRGCKTFIIHARKALLKKLDPKQNREIPPLDYPLVHQMKTDFPHCDIILNGGLKSFEEAQNHLSHLDGVMIGRMAYYDPYQFIQADQLFFNSKAKVKSREAIFAAYLLYCDEAFEEKVPISFLIKPILNLFHGVKGARAFRQHISEGAILKKDLGFLKEALNYII